MEYDAHNYKRRLEGISNRIKSDSAISERDKELIIGFRENCFLEGISAGRITKYMYNLRNLSHWLGTEYEKATKEDIRLLLISIEKKMRFIKTLGQEVSYKENTKSDFKKTLKKFYRWLGGTGDYPEQVKWIKCNGNKGNRIKLPEEMLSEDDIKDLINAADNPRDRALIAILYESGCRIGEMLFLRIKHLKFDTYGAQLLVNGKTGYRRIRIIASAPYLTDWLNRHPLKDDPEAPLWITRNQSTMSYVAVRIALSRIAEKAGVKKKINPHNFRHSRATYLANHLTEAQMKEHFGWVQSSYMASIYVHLSGRDVDNALLKVYGIKKPEEQEESQLNPKICQRCQEVNPFTNMFCFKCGMILDEQLRNEKIQKDMDRSNADRMIEMIMKDQEFKDLFIKKLSGVNNL